MSSSPKPETERAEPAPNPGGVPVGPGDVLLGRYRVERLIGEGGTGVVLSATQLGNGRRVAIKFLRRALASDEVRTRFEREARAIGRIASEHVVHLLDTGALDDGALFMVMEHLDGRDLARVLKEDGPLPVRRAVDCVLQVCQVLALAHARGIVHRDLKPANLFLADTPDGHVHVKVVDFGISKILDKKLVEGDGKPHEVTHAFTVLGSPRYMAPEQVRNSKDVDARADLWSVGAVLFQLVTGKHAFEADSNIQASVAVLSGEPRSLCAVDPDAPPGLAAIVGRCLTKDVTKRFQSAEELARALLPFASDPAEAERRLVASLAEPPRPSLEPAPAAPSRSPATDTASAAPPPAAESEPPRPSARPRSSVIHPRTVPAVRASGSPVSTLTLTLLAGGAFVVILGALLAVRAAGGGAARAVAPASTVLTRPAVPLDAGNTNP